MGERAAPLAEQDADRIAPEARDATSASRRRKSAIGRSRRRGRSATMRDRRTGCPAAAPQPRPCSAPPLIVRRSGRPSSVKSAASTSYGRGAHVVRRPGSWSEARAGRGRQVPGGDAAAGRPSRPADIRLRIRAIRIRAACNPRGYGHPHVPAAAPIELRRPLSPRGAPHRVQVPHRSRGTSREVVVLAVRVLVLFGVGAANLPGKYTDAENNESTIVPARRRRVDEGARHHRGAAGRGAGADRDHLPARGRAHRGGPARIAADRAELNRAIEENKDDIYRAVSPFGEPRRPSPATRRC